LRVHAISVVNGTPAFRLAAAALRTLAGSESMMLCSRFNLA